MIIIDTNVLSAIMEPEPVEPVKCWFDQQVLKSLYITAITLYEIRYGFHLLPISQRRHDMEMAFNRVISERFQTRLLHFDSDAAERTAMLAAKRRATGQTVDFRDTAIAGIALARRASIATRNIKHFTQADVPVINPWQPH